jgi:predicted Zn-dependent peptidase
MGMPVIGSLENIERFKRQDLLAHVQAHYVAGNTVVAAAGDIDVPAFLSLGERLFAGMRTGGGAAETVVPRHVGGALGQRFSQVSQVFVNVAYPLAPASRQALREPRWRVAASLAAMLFGGGMSAPFTDTVRERLGLAYTADANSEGGDAWFNFIVHAVTTPDKLTQLTEATADLLRAHARGFDPVHLERSKNQLTVARVRSAERPYATLERGVEELFMRGTVTSAADDIALIEGITHEEVRSVFEHLVAQRPPWP